MLAGENFSKFVELYSQLPKFKFMEYLVNTCILFVTEPSP